MNRMAAGLGPRENNSANVGGGKNGRREVRWWSLAGLQKGMIFGGGHLGALVLHVR